MRSLHNREMKRKEAVNMYDKKAFDCGRCFGASFGDCDECMKRKEKETKMDEYITKGQAIQALIDCGEVRGYAFRSADDAISQIPAADVVERTAGTK